MHLDLLKISSESTKNGGLVELVEESLDILGAGAAGLRKAGAQILD